MNEMIKKDGKRPGHSAKLSGSDSDRKYVMDLIRQIVDKCPSRRPASHDELVSQQIMQGEFDRLGLQTTWHHFKFSESLYADLVLHFGLATLGTAVSGIFPLAGLVLHGLSSGSYAAQSTRKHRVLRRLLKAKPSQNLLATMPADGPAGTAPALRIVFLGHADAAFTGVLFDPRVVKMAMGTKPPFDHTLGLATAATASLIPFDLARMVFGPVTLVLRPLEWALTAPAIAAFLLNLEVVLRDKVVPGANDNLTGTVALPVLAARLAAKKPANVELVFVVTGCEEAALGGGMALADEMKNTWDKGTTVIIGLDSLANGQLLYTDSEGEIVTLRTPKWLSDVAAGTAASNPEFNKIKGFGIPVGGTDVAAFLARGYDGLCLVAIDEKFGSPTYYHTVEDSPENLDEDHFMNAIDYAEALALAVIDARLK
jgi:hypothetical protein